MDDFEELKRKAFHNLFEIDAQAEVESGAEAPDYIDGDGMLFAGQVAEDSNLLPDQLSEDTRVQNLECQITSLKAQHEVMADYMKKIEKAVIELQRTIQQHSGALGMSSVEMGK